MNYISRNKLIDCILNEDAAFEGENNPRKRFSFINTTNAKNAEKHSKGGQSRLTGDAAGKNLLFRAPSKKELVAAEEALDMRISGDYQMGQNIVLSKVLFDFDILHKVYRTKKDSWNDQTFNAATVDKLLERIRQIFSKKNGYAPDTPVEEVAERLENSTDVLEKEYGVRFPELVGAVPTWGDLLKINPATKSPQMPKGFNPLLMKNLSILVGEQKAKALYPKINEFLITQTAKGFKTPKAFGKYVANCETLRAVLNEPLLKKAFDSAMTSNLVTDVEELVVYLNKHLKDIREEKQEGHAMSIIHHNALKNLQRVDVMMKRAGFEDGVRNINSMFDYLQEKHPDTFAHVCRTYGLDEDSVHQFNSYQEFCNWLYGDPERLGRIYLSAGVEGKGGARMNVLYKDEERKIKSLRKQKEAGTRGPRGITKADFKKKLDEYLAAAEQLEKEIAEMPDKKSPEALEKIALRKKFRKKYTDGMFRFKRMSDDAGTRKTIDDELAATLARKEDISNAEFDRLKDDAEIDKFQEKYGKEKTRYADGVYDVGEGYYTMAFTFNISSPSEVVDFIEGWLDKYFNMRETKAGKEDLINVTAESGKYEGRMRMYPCTRFIVDYPEGSALYNKLEKMPKEKRAEWLTKLIDALKDMVDKSFRTKIDLVTTDKAHKPCIMSKEEAPGFSFRGH